VDSGPPNKQLNKTLALFNDQDTEVADQLRGVKEVGHKKNKSITVKQERDQFENLLPEDRGKHIFKVTDRDPYTYVKKPEAPPPTYYKPKTAIIEVESVNHKMKHPSSAHPSRARVARVPVCMKSTVSCDLKSRL